ncbi:hypothetical protein FALCPG4_012180 [Fusarium falciforme]
MSTGASSSGRHSRSGDEAREAPIMVSVSSVRDQQPGESVSSFFNLERLRRRRQVPWPPSFAAHRDILVVAARVSCWTMPSRNERSATNRTESSTSEPPLR